MPRSTLRGRIRRRSERIVSAGVILVVGCFLIGCSMPTPSTRPTPSESTATSPTGSSTATPSPSPPAAGFNPETKFSPLFTSTVAVPEPVEGSDGRVHLAYELLMTNAAGLPVRLTTLEVRDAATRQPLLTVTGAKLKADVTPVAGTTGDEGTDDPTKDPQARTMAPSTTWVAWLDVSVATRADVPARLEHRLLGTLIRPSGPAAPLDVTVGAVDTGAQTPTVLSAPVGEGRWYMSEGCCTDDTHHRRGLVPINGNVMVAQRFAIDFYLLDDQNRTWIGDPKKVTSYLTYRKPIVAAAPGTVVVSEDGLPNSTSLPEPPPIPPIAQTVGNHVIVEIGPGTYVLYAHMDPGSVKVRVGQQVAMGDELGLIGTSGNSTTPHVHFQLLTTPTFFPSNSRPFVFDRFELLGRVPERLWDDNLGLQPTGKLPFVPAAPAGEHQDELPLDRTVVRFAGG